MKHTCIIYQNHKYSNTISLKSIRSVVTEADVSYLYGAIINWSHIMESKSYFRYIIMWSHFISLCIMIANRTSKRKAKIKRRERRQILCIYFRITKSILILLFEQRTINEFFLSEINAQIIMSLHQYLQFKFVSNFSSWKVHINQCCIYKHWKDSNKFMVLSDIFYINKITETTSKYV